MPPKSGCTTWKTILVNNSGIKPLPNDFKIGKVHDGSWLKAQGIVPLMYFNKTMQRSFLTDEKFYRFMVARHPFECLYSAFVDNFVPPPDPIMKSVHGTRIRQLFHPNLTTDQCKEVD